MPDPNIRFAAPLHPGGRICLLCGSVTVGAVFPPVGNNPGRNPWAWRLFSFGANPVRDGRAKDETTAKGHLTAAFALTLAEARLQPIGEGAAPDRDQFDTTGQEVQQLQPRLAPGLYEVFWKSGGSSRAAVGCTSNGDNWIAPTNWLRPAMLREFKPGEWGDIDRLVQIQAEKDNA